MPTWPTITDGVTRLSNALFGLIKTYIDDSLTGQGLPSGGATGDLLQKNSATNYDAGWTDSPTVDALTLDTAAAEATGVAKLYWDTQDVTAALGLNANITYHLGAQELVRVSNRTGSAISAGKAVYILGAHGDRPEVALADASVEATAATTLGIAAESIADNDTGYVCVSGLLRNLNTNHLTVGQLVWLSETAGELTSTRPTQPAHGVFMGLCVKQGPGTSGILYVSVVNGLELEELHDVLISSPAAGDLLKRNAGNTLWVNAAPAALTTTDDTNVTLTLGGNASTALVNAASLTAGWTGTLAAARLNSNVVQSVVNDTNVTGSISTQALTLGWTGQLALARGGTGASTAQAAINALAGAVTSGSYLRGNGTNVVMSTIQAGDVPTLNQNTTGSAATLTTTRTLWGQNFNGSANVTGALTSVTTITASGAITAPNFADATGTYNVNLGSGGSEGRGLVAGYSGGSYGGIGYNVRHTATGGTWIAPGTDTASYLVFNAGGFTFYGAAGGAAGRTLSFTTLGSFNSTGVFTIASNLNLTAGQINFGAGPVGALYISSNRLRVRSESTDDVANFASYGMYLPKTGQTAGLYVESPIEARGGLSMGNSAANGTITYGATTSNTANRLVQRDGGGDVYVGNVYASGWFRNYGVTGLYNQTNSRGIIEAQAGSASYGNMTTYGTGYNGWDGWSIGTSTYQVAFMGRPSVADWAIYTPLRGWAIYQNHSAHAGVSIGGSSPLSSYTLRIEGNGYTNSGHYAYAFYGHSNVAGTGNAIYCPNGVYSTGTNWLYGTMYLNGNTINGIGSAYLNAATSGGFYCSSQWAFYYDYSNNRFGCWTSTTTAGYGFTFNTSVQVNGTITVAGSKNFAIVHPIDDTKQLVYASIEGPRVDVLHRGAAIVTTHAILDLDEEAGLLPGTCARLMRDLQCQVTNVDDHFCQIRARIDGTQLHIYTDTPLPTRIAWIVLGERQDAEIRESHMTDNEGRLITEPDRPETSEGAPLPAR